MKEYTWFLNFEVQFPSKRVLSMTSRYTAGLKTIHWATCTLNETIVLQFQLLNIKVIAF